MTEFEQYFSTLYDGTILACDKMKMQEVNWTLRTAEEYKVCKNAGALCIFEFIRPEITDEDE